MTKKKLQEIQENISKYKREELEIIADEFVSQLNRQTSIIDLLEKDANYYNAAFDSVDDFIYVIDKDYRFVLNNKSFERFMLKLGINPDVIGKHLLDALPFVNAKTINEYDRVFESGHEVNSEEVTHVANNKIITKTRKIPIFEGEGLLCVGAFAIYNTLIFNLLHQL